MNRVFIIVFSFTLFSCAVPYKSINPANANYSIIDSIDRLNITISDSKLFTESGNKHYQKKAKNKGIYLVPVLICNSTKDTIILTKHNIEFFNNYEPVDIIYFNEYSKLLRQKTGWHSVEIGIGLYYNFILVATIISPLFSVTPFLICTSLLTPYGTRNFIQSYKSNSIMYENLKEFDLIGIPIAPGYKKYGIICLKTDNINNLIFRLKNNE